ncbi:MAG: hypothetical protein U1E97_04310 [Alphaproteobacteria bacterium]
MPNVPPPDGDASPCRAGLAPVVELLRVLLRMKSEASEVAPRLIREAAMIWN